MSDTVLAPTAPAAASSTTAQSAAATPTGSAAASAGVNPDFETFLNLLTAQLNNQDPLSPLDSTQFVAQLAQFSTVEQQIQSNETLASILEVLGGGGAGLAAWLGVEVEGPASQNFTGDPITISVPPNASADSAQLVVRDASGVEIFRESVDPLVSTYTWSGAASGGETAPNGEYRIVIERRNGEEALPDAAPLGFSTVVEARIAGGGAELVLSNGAIVLAADVTAVRSPEEAASDAEEDSA